MEANNTNFSSSTMGSHELQPMFTVRGQPDGSPFNFGLVDGHLNWHAQSLTDRQRLHSSADDCLVQTPVLSAQMPFLSIVPLSPKPLLMATPMIHDAPSVSLPSPHISSVAVLPSHLPTNGHAARLNNGATAPQVAGAPVLLGDPPIGRAAFCRNRTTVTSTNREIGSSPSETGEETDNLLPTRSACASGGVGTQNLVGEHGESGGVLSRLWRLATGGSTSNATQSGFDGHASTDARAGLGSPRNNITLLSECQIVF
ncbi:unnamed protein product [Protopolystoma xenopodis]|uniref:Uncharacterized protein n=1 Tax=Protopolystoma xenopodis TaxID=117903 RepID=A0A448XJH7_9PLAT|nr:unnamed protein product [Protopolystoma xenopodis]